LALVPSLALTGGLSGLAAIAAPDKAFALSQLRAIPGDEAPEAESDHGKDEAPAVSAPGTIPLPDPLVNKPPSAPRSNQADAPKPPASEPVEVLTDVSKIPKPVARMRELIVEAAASGDIERLRPLLGKGETATAIGDSQEETDPVAAVKGLSGDADGLEILAIMLDVLSTGFTVVDKGTPDEMYVWPYFAAKPLDSLTPPEKVDLMRLVTAGDVASMQEFGSYNFYRVGITPDGQWKFFIGGD
jgi:hypothetical protein